MLLSVSLFCQTEHWWLLLEMVSKFLRKKSKRMSCRTKYKIERKVREHKRKVRKESRKAGHKPKSKKDPGIPNKFPFKEQVLKEAELRKVREEEMKLKQKQERKKLMDKNRNLAELVKDAEKRGTAHAQKPLADNKTASPSVDGSLKAYYREFKKVVESADVVLEVLDARDPLGSRCPQVEEQILASGVEKKLVLVLNKIDLVPRDNVVEWLRYLRNEFPTVPFKASTQSQGEHLSQVRVASVKAMNKELLQSKHSLGANLLMKLIGNYCGRGAGGDPKTSVTVGVIGFPNVGKSSIINSLKRSRACNVGSVPGVTKSMQVIQIDKRIKLLDSPGIIMADVKRNPAEAALKNCVKISDLQDPQGAVEAILKKCSTEQLVLKYNLAGSFSSTEEFLSLLARRFGRLKKGGVGDVSKAARMLLQDWTMGKITYYNEPPAQYKPSTHISARIVAEPSEEFALMKELADEEKNTLEDLVPTKRSTDIILTKEAAVAFTDGVVDEQQVVDMEQSDTEQQHDDDDLDGDEEMESDNDEEVADKPTLVIDSAMKSKSESRKGRRDIDGSMKKMLGEPDPASNLQLGKLAKKAFKRKQKREKKEGKRIGELSDNAQLDMDDDGGDTEVTPGQERIEHTESRNGNAAPISNDDYDFNTDFKL